MGRRAALVVGVLFSHRCDDLWWWWRREPDPSPTGLVAWTRPVGSSRGHPGARQPDEGDLIGACRPDRSPGCPPGRRACHPLPSHRAETAITSMAQATAAQPITVGVDTHLDSHVAHAGDQLGRRLGTRSVPTTPPATRTGSPGPAGSASPSPGGWKAPAPPAPPWPASWPQRPGRGGGQPTRRPGPPPPRQVRPDRCRGGRPRGPGRPGHRGPRPEPGRWR
jgi:hypothetical protein